LSSNKQKSPLEDFKLFYEELVFITGRKSVNRIQRPRLAAADSK